MEETGSPASTVVPLEQEMYHFPFDRVAKSHKEVKGDQGAAVEEQESECFKRVNSSSTPLRGIECPI